ncbi:MAG: sugar ABC transporter ATP-binding protein [Planctomycetes bacterium]|nr:sugar ABC transporter ATP-binding protein [Planctomycetota bacterium]
MPGEIYLEMRGIKKSFLNVHALRGVDIAVVRGEVHALLGENGAGKSTLMKILAGVYQADAGDIYIQGGKQAIACVADAQRLGISVMHQELCLAENLSVCENIFMGRENDNRTSPFVDKKMMVEKTRQLLDTIQAGFTATDIVGDLSIANKQIVEIARALSIGTNIIVMDEPTSSLTAKEVQSLFSVIRDLRAKGISIVYISHRLEELFAIADRVTVLRDGQYIGTVDIAGTDEEALIGMMVGRRLDDFYHNRTGRAGDRVTLEVTGLTRHGVIEDVSFRLHEGEILGFSGLVGAGRSEIARAIYGVDTFDSGEIRVDGAKCRIRTPLDALKQGIVLVPEDRKKEGLFLEHSVGFNITIGFLERFFRRLLGLNRNRENGLVDESIRALAIKTPSARQLSQFLSGGNQQKVLLAKALGVLPKVLILDEPTRGIDVGSKSEIYQIMHRLADDGMSIILISSDLPEIVHLSDRVVVVAEGRVAATLAGADISQEKIMFYATGGKSHAVA